ncbi:MAG: cysteine desulfurase [Coprobacillus sp.]|nr:cysteine desulfurase [Coprobacillus sp.]
MKEIAKVIYFDNAASTKTSSENLSLFMETSANYYANPSSHHSLAYEASHKLSEARSDILKALNIKGSSVIFTSGATEANNLAIKGVAYKYASRGRHLITSAVEHPSVLEVFKELEKEGYEVTYLPVKEDCSVDIDSLKAAIRKDTILVSLIYVNNEVGSINPIPEIASLLKEYPKIVFHTDASQSVGKAEIDVSEADLVTISSHKIYGTKGSGALIKKNNISLSPLFNGGGQEEGLRSGTYDLPSAVVLSSAVKNAVKNVREYIKTLTPLKDALFTYLEANPALYHINSPKDCTPFIINFSLLTKKASVVVEALSREGIMVSTRSSCHEKSNDPSHVVMSMFNDEKLGSESIRVSFAPDNTLEEVNYFIETLDRIIKELY